MSEIPATPIIVTGNSNSNIFRRILIQDINTGRLFEFKVLRFMSN